MSGATIDDIRYDLSTDLDYYMEDAKDTFSAGFSKEQDYLSVHGGLGTEHSLFDDNTTVSARLIGQNGETLVFSRTDNNLVFSLAKHRVVRVFLGVAPQREARSESPPATTPPR